MFPLEHPDILGVPYKDYVSNTRTTQFLVYCRTQEWYWDMMVCTVFNRGSLLKWFISGRLLSRLKTLPNLGPSEFNQAARTYGEYDPCEFAVQAEPTRVSVTRSPFAIKMIDQKCMPGAGRINPTKKS